jgi:hypothetical protein
MGEDAVEQVRRITWEAGEYPYADVDAAKVWRADSGA